MFKHKIWGFLAIVALVYVSGQGHAHHSSASTFTRDRSSTVEGIITDFRFRNPHVLVYLDVSNDDGSVTNWMAEGSSATGWRRNNWQSDTLKPGDRVRITGDATIDGSPMVWIDQIEYLDSETGETLAILRGSENPAEAFAAAATGGVAADPESELTFIPMNLPTGEPNFTGITAQTQEVRPPWRDDPEPAYNETGLAALAAWDVEDDPQVFCDPPGLVRQAAYTPYGHKLTQYPDHVTIEYEEYGSKRAIFFGDELPRPGPKSHLGDSVARYEGDSLVIESVNLYPNASGHYGKPLSGEIRVTEVYTRADDPKYGSQVKITTTVVDPSYLTEPWTISRTTRYVEGYEFIENECVPPMRERPTPAW